ncbi:MAG: adenylate kinase [Anaerolineae bacterium]|nr:adenylate kinase [Thermoflexales bacterium]MDW8408450.1 adenylate kinase [Anaerolineae bacterium]
MDTSKQCWRGIILLGGPGSGKGTQAVLLAQKLGIAHISTGDLFRENIRMGTELGKVAKTYIEKGELVPDEVTVRMVRERVNRPDCTNGFILDGFPRTVAQADALNQVLAEMHRSLTAVLNLQVAPDVLLERLSRRWTCKACGAVFPEFSAPPRAGCKKEVCDGELYQRPDDKPETQRHRIEVYREQTAPLEAYYAERGLLVEIDGENSIERVHQLILDAVRCVEEEDRHTV